MYAAQCPTPLLLPCSFHMLTLDFSFDMTDSIVDLQSEVSEDLFEVEVILQYAWVCWISQWESKKDPYTSIVFGRKFNTVEGFWDSFLDYHPSNLADGFCCHIFKEGIMPFWEDRINATGGYLKIMCKTPLDAIRLWEAISKTVVLEQLNPHTQVCSLCSHMAHLETVHSKSPLVIVTPL